MNTKSLWAQLRHTLGTYPGTAAEWAVRAQCSDVTRQELLVLNEWLKADPANAEDYARVNKIAYLGLVLREHRSELAKLHGYQRLLNKERLETTSLTQWRPLQWAAASLVCGILTISAVAYWQFSSRDRYVVQHGEQRSVTLSDGSHMVVNTDSEVKVLYDDTARIIVLPRGEAFFDVAKIPDRPFIVRAGDMQIQAIGTKFSVRREGADTRVVVTAGRVRVSRDSGSGADTRDLVPGQQLQVGSTASELPQVVRVDAKRMTSWSSGAIEFEDATLSDVVSEVNRYTSKRFVIVDPALKQIRLTGQFKVGDMKSVQFALRDRFGIEAKEGEDQIRLASTHSYSTQPTPP